MSIKTPLRRLADTFGIEHVGSTLLEDLAKGLYQPGEVIREYVQNAIDAHRVWASEYGEEPEGPIQIEIRKDAVSILDYGIGMNEKEIRDVKGISLSKKRNSDVRQTGHKGVGIWAGLSFFKRLTLSSTKSGSNRRYDLTIDFENIVNAIDEGASIGDVLNPNYSIYEFDADKDDHYTTVTLDTPVRSQDWFLDAEKVTDAVRRICPCQVDPNFVFQDKLKEWYEDNQLRTYPIEINGNPVYRSFPSSVEDFKTASITINDKPYAIYWKAINKTSGILKPNKDQLVGFRIIQDGFALGRPNLYDDRNLPNYDELKLASYLSWHIGEIHVISPDLRPNLERNEFEESEPTRQFIKRIREWYQETERKSRTIAAKRSKLKELKDDNERVDNLLQTAAPLLIDENDRTWLQGIINKLLTDEKRLQDYRGKRGTQVPVEIEALRDDAVKALTRDLSNKVNSIIPQAKQTGKKQKKSAASNVVINQATTTDNTPLTFSQPGGSIGYDSYSLSADQYKDRGGVDSSSAPNSQGVILIDVALGLLEEVLTKELPNQPELAAKVIKKLRMRINTLKFNG